MITYQDSFPYRLYSRDIPLSAGVLAWFQPDSWKGSSSNIAIRTLPCDRYRNRGWNMESRPERRKHFPILRRL